MLNVRHEPVFSELKIPLKTNDPNDFFINSSPLCALSPRHKTSRGSQKDVHAFCFKTRLLEIYLSKEMQNTSSTGTKYLLERALILS